MERPGDDHRSAGNRSRRLPSWQWTSVLPERWTSKNRVRRCQILRVSVRSASALRGIPLRFHQQPRNCFNIPPFRHCLLGRMNETYLNWKLPSGFVFWDARRIATGVVVWTAARRTATGVVVCATVCWGTTCVATCTCGGCCGGCWGGWEGGCCGTGVAKTTPINTSKINCTVQLKLIR